jgi:hypothetical protein
VRALEIVEVPPAVESALDSGLVGEPFEGEDFLLERAVEAFVLAAALRMIGPAVDDLDAELQEPDAETSPLPPRIPPRSAVVDVDRVGQAIASKRIFDQRLDGLALLVGAGADAQREPVNGRRRRSAGGRSSCRRASPNP